MNSIRGRWQKGFIGYQPYEAFIYLWYDRGNKMYYLGSHVGRVSDGYAHSSQSMRPFNTRTIPAGFRRRILQVGTAANIPLLETEIIKKHRLHLNPKYHNKVCRIPDATGRIRSHTARENYSMAQLRKKYPELQGAWECYLETLKKVRRKESSIKRLKTKQRKNYILNAAEVARIRSLPTHYSVQKKLALEFNLKHGGVKYGCQFSPIKIWQIQTGRTYKWLPMPTPQTPIPKHFKTVRRFRTHMETTTLPNQIHTEGVVL